MKHVHCELIKAWADGATIEFKKGDIWETIMDPLWTKGVEYRIKPKEPNYGEIAELGYRSHYDWAMKSPSENWKNSANAVIEAYKNHHDLS